jgi:signal transduction histidine kinase
MKKVAVVYIIAVIAPSLVLAWLALRSLRDQQFALERQRSLLYQGVADAMAKDVNDFIAEQQRQFRDFIEGALDKQPPLTVAYTCDALIRTNWPLASVGFAVTLGGNIACPSPLSSPEAKVFCENYGRFLVNREIAEVYWNPKMAANSFNNFGTNDASAQTQQLQLTMKNQARYVTPQQQVFVPANSQAAEPQQVSKVSSTEAEFRQLIGDSSDGVLARFLDNKLSVLLWYRSPRDASLVFGAQLAIPKLVEQLKEWTKDFEPAHRDGICVAVLDDRAKPVLLSRPGFEANWKHPFVATEIGEALPHWEAAVYLTDPGELARSAHTIRLTLGLLIATLVLAIGVGSWLIVTDLNRQLKLARQKTDFVGNVSHELKTPLTSIRMFSELLAQDRVTEPARQKSYLTIITAEAARLTRLINNVLDFARIERDEKKYDFRKFDLVTLVRDTVESYRPHLENNGFALTCSLTENPLPVRGDGDALAQVIVNLLSNAEKYSNDRKDIAVEVSRKDGDDSNAEIKVTDRGTGVPTGSSEKIFEKFYRAHDSLSSGIQGSGLGLTLARQIARAHGGDLTFEPREGGGSCFIVRLPLTTD